MAANPKVEIAAIEDGRWDTATSERLAGQLYARFAATGGLDAVYGMADNQAVAAIKAADAAGIAVGTGPKQLIVVGGNCQKEGLDAIGAGKMHSSVTQIPTDLGRRAADADGRVLYRQEAAKGRAAADRTHHQGEPRSVAGPVHLLMERPPASRGRYARGERRAWSILTVEGLSKSFGA